MRAEPSLRGLLEAVTDDDEAEDYARTCYSFSERLWMDEILHHLENMVETLVWWYLQGNRFIPGFLRWCEMDFATIHSNCIKGMHLKAKRLWGWIRIPIWYLGNNYVHIPLLLWLIPAVLPGITPFE